MTKSLVAFGIFIEKKKSLQFVDDKSIVSFFTFLVRFFYFIGCQRTSPNSLVRAAIKTTLHYDQSHLIWCVIFILQAFCQYASNTISDETEDDASEMPGLPVLLMLLAVALLYAFEVWLKQWQSVPKIKTW